MLRGPHRRVGTSSVDKEAEMDAIAGKKVGRVTVLAVALVFLGNAAAAGIPVVDIPRTIQSTLNQINTYSQRLQDAAEYGENATRWMQTLRHYQQQLIRIRGAAMISGLPPRQLV